MRESLPARVGYLRWGIPFASGPKQPDREVLMLPRKSSGSRRLMVALFAAVFAVFQALAGSPDASVEIAATQDDPTKGGK